MGAKGAGSRHTSNANVFFKTILEYEVSEYEVSEYEDKQGLSTNRLTSLMAHTAQPSIQLRSRNRFALPYQDAKDGYDDE